MAGKPFGLPCLNLGISQKTQSFIFYLKPAKNEMKKIYLTGRAGFTHASPGCCQKNSSLLFQSIFLTHLRTFHYTQSPNMEINIIKIRPKRPYNKALYFFAEIGAIPAGSIRIIRQRDIPEP
ncbi:MAG: hypothetical protein AMJ60_12035 [Desulfobacterales bacterium SG8_35]|nr:MAG: hypothetical protein AMJ60_12035 [Desulfobacterales bacterium SG8_35]